jgi:hypothetical protein
MASSRTGNPGRRGCWPELELGLQQKGGARPWRRRGRWGGDELGGLEAPALENMAPCCSRSPGGAGRALGCCCAREKEQGALRRAMVDRGEEGRCCCVPARGGRRGSAAMRGRELPAR